MAAPIRTLDDAHLVELERPRTRGDCAGVPRPCPFYACKWHLGCDVDHNGRLRVHVQPEDLTRQTSTCALDVAELDGLTLEQTGAHVGLTRERVRQIEAKALERLILRFGFERLADLLTP